MNKHTSERKAYQCPTEEAKALIRAWNNYEKRSCQKGRTGVCENL